MGDFEKLIEAAKHGNVADVRAVAQRHRDLINQRDQTGATAVHYAAFGGHRDVVQALVQQAQKSTQEMVNSVRHLQGGQSNTCGS
jgi:ankyrin repeat protein